MFKNFIFIVKFKMISFKIKDIDNIFIRTEIFEVLFIRWVLNLLNKFLYL